MEELALKPTEKINLKNQNYIERKDLSLDPIWIAKHREQVSKYKYATAVGAVDVYTVPKGFTFYLFSFHMNVVCDGAGGNFFCVSEIGCLSHPYFGMLSSNSSIVGNVSVSNDFSIPLKFNQGEIIKLVNGSLNTTTSCSISGWLEPLQAQ